VRPGGFSGSQSFLRTSVAHAARSSRTPTSWRSVRSLAFSEHGDFQLFRCHVGRAFSLEGLEIEQAESVERALWAAARALEESVSSAARAGAR
jgi:hypothetical protein